MKLRALSVVWHSLLRDAGEKSVTGGALAFGVCMAAAGLWRRERTEYAPEPRRRADW